MNALEREVALQMGDLILKNISLMIENKELKAKIEKREGARKSKNEKPKRKPTRRL